MKDKFVVTPGESWLQRLAQTLAGLFGIFTALVTGVGIWIWSEHRSFTLAAFVATVRSFWNWLIQALVTLLSPLNDLGLFRDEHLSKNPPILLVIYAVLTTLGLFIVFSIISYIVHGKPSSIEEREAVLRAEQAEEERRAAAEPDEEVLEDEDDDTSSDPEDQEESTGEPEDSDDQET